MAGELLQELRSPATVLAHVPAELPPIPGGWSLRTYTIGGVPRELVMPANPDAFLDDPSVHAAHQRDEYMPYWAYLWPASLQMAELLPQLNLPPQFNVLELGSGVGLVGLAALQQQWRVTMTDYDPVAVTVAMLNAERNQLAAHATGEVLDWRTPAGPRADGIIACEVTYERGNHPLLLDVLDARLHTGGSAWFADAGRTQAEFFPALARERGYHVELLDKELRPLSRPAFGSFQVFRLQRA